MITLVNTVIHNRTTYRKWYFSR